ncbi:MAG: hypothetical protein NC918_05995, partial [Candidatus Omnitrophica bacterium]|nr:hypothetical protein [Candidatus Omnitrophota bacterium]
SQTTQSMQLQTWLQQQKLQISQDLGNNSTPADNPPRQPSTVAPPSPSIFPQKLPSERSFNPIPPKLQQQLPPQQPQLPPQNFTLPSDKPRGPYFTPYTNNMGSDLLPNKNPNNNSSDLPPNENVSHNNASLRPAGLPYINPFNNNQGSQQ